MVTWKLKVLVSCGLLLFGCNESNPQPAPQNGADQADPGTSEVTSAGDGVAKDIVTSDAGEDLSSQCSGFSTECGASDECEPYEAWPKEHACAVGEPTVDPELLGCGGGERLCSAEWTWGHPPDDPDDSYMFVTSCMPEGWATAEVPPCEQ